MKDEIVKLAVKHGLDDIISNEDSEREVLMGIDALMEQIVVARSADPAKSYTKNSGVEIDRILSELVESRDPNCLLDATDKIVTLAKEFDVWHPDDKDLWKFIMQLVVVYGVSMMSSDKQRATIARKMLWYMFKRPDYYTVE